MKAILALAPLLAILGGCSSAPRKHMAVHADLEPFVPPGATTLVGIKLAAIAETEFYKTTLAPLTASMVGEFTKRSGIDASKDIEELLIALRGEDQPILLARGKWDAAALQAKLTAEGFQTSMAEGQKVYTRDRASILFPNANVVAIGPAATVTDAAKKAGIPAPLSPLFEGIGPGAQIWAVSLADFKNFRAPERSNLQNIEKLAGSVQSLSGWADVRQGVHLRVAGNTASEDDAKKLHGALRGLMGLARLSTPANQQDLLKAFDTVELKQEAAKVRASIDMTAEQFDQLRGMLPKLPGAN